METTRRGFLGAALALAAAATVPGTAKALSEDDAAKLARLLSTPGSVIRGQEFHIRRDVGLAELRDITVIDCKFVMYGDFNLTPAKCSNVEFFHCSFNWVDGAGLRYHDQKFERRNVIFRPANGSQIAGNMAAAQAGDVIDMCRTKSERTMWYVNLG